MASFEPASSGQHGWLAPFLVTIAILSFVATAVSFVWIMQSNMGTATAQQEFVEPDPQLLKDLVVPKGFTEVRSVPACLATRISRCYITELTGPQAMAAAEQYVEGSEVLERVSYIGGPDYSYWCSDALGAPAFFSLRPNLINAKSQGLGSWKLPDEPKFDDRLVLGIALAESPTCG